MKRLIWLAQAGLFYCFTWLVACIPAGQVDRAGAAVGRLMYRVLGRRRRVAEDGIRQSLPFMQRHPAWQGGDASPERLARQTFENIGRSLVEATRLYHGKGEPLVRQLELRGKEHFDAALARGKGIMFLTGHCGNWELGAIGFALLCRIHLAVVARKQDNPYLNRMVERMRQQYDNRIIYKQGALREMLTVFRHNGAVGLLVDQAVIPDEGCLIRFLGRPAWASKAPVTMAQKTGVAVLPSFIHRAGERQIITINPALQFSDDASPAGVAANVQLYSSCIEEQIIAHPTDWYWVHRRWKRA
jgi:KDO2-lipid IV(A) lauroyltransferase